MDRLAWVNFSREDTPTFRRKGGQGADPPGAGRRLLEVVVAVNPRSSAVFDPFEGKEVKNNRSGGEKEAAKSKQLLQ